jgi:hypothetical protein
VAHGTSCRHHIHNGANRQALHTVRVLRLIPRHCCISGCRSSYASAE